MSWWRSDVRDIKLMVVLNMLMHLLIPLYILQLINIIQQFLELPLRKFYAVEKKI